MKVAAFQNRFHKRFNQRMNIVNRYGDIVIKNSTPINKRFDLNKVHDHSVLKSEGNSPLLNSKSDSVFASTSKLARHTIGQNFDFMALQDCKESPGIREQLE